MANFALTTFTTSGTLEEVILALETEMETVDTAKTVLLIDIDAPSVGNNHKYAGYAIYAD